MARPNRYLPGSRIGSPVTYLTKGSNPELHRLVTRYQMHKCSNYCKRKTKFAKGKYVFVTRCKFNFPREACASSKLNPVEESLKARNKIYQLARSELEVRVNDYNPVLLYVWKANIDIQFVVESSLALAHYVSGYVTKARGATSRRSGKT